MDKEARVLAGAALVVGLIVAGFLMAHQYVGHPASDKASSDSPAPSGTLDRGLNLTSDEMDRVDKRLRDQYEEGKFDNLSRRIDCLDSRVEDPGRIC